ncbi:predicted protein [Lichtheimia corymbifera JMRC:FSU:9682]|uniref:Uncharacterized protein n=1 Tax=Lichtheimia corymbifera JMRC:FSU:9682 TaxID=1263082 RepID=A0A068SBX5_9FUNG|nr:predicted protein [Lichtheimia corymbifera JMRC:FSU:9682]
MWLRQRTAIRFQGGCLYDMARFQGVRSSLGRFIYGWSFSTSNTGCLLIQQCTWITSLHKTPFNDTPIDLSLYDVGNSMKTPGHSLLEQGWIIRRYQRHSSDDVRSTALKLMYPGIVPKTCHYNYLYWLCKEAEMDPSLNLSVKAASDNKSFLMDVQSQYDLTIIHAYILIGSCEFFIRYDRLHLSSSLQIFTQFIVYKHQEVTSTMDGVSWKALLIKFVGGTS